MIKREQQIVDENALSDERVWIRESGRDTHAFRPLYDRYFKRVYLFVLHRVCDKEVAGDLTQQVFLKALTNIGTYEFRGLPFSSWLFRIAINTCNSFFHLNKTHRTVLLEEGMGDTLFEDLTHDQTYDEWMDVLPEVFEKLPAADLQLVELRYFEERPFKEIAEILEISETHAKVKMYRVLDKMKKIFLKIK